jgi:hypothetical protein
MAILSGNKSMKKYLKNPISIYLLWGMLFGLFSLAIPILSIGHSGGEQRPLTLFAYALNILFYGFFVLSIITTFLFLRWFKKYWYINVFIFLTSGGLLVTVYLLNK